MNVRTRLLFLLGLCNFICLNRTDAQDIDDCDRNDSISVLKSKKQAIDDSLELLYFIPAESKVTAACTVPLGSALGMEFNIQDDRIYGFFQGIENADEYLVIISDNDLPPVSPSDGFVYKAGAVLGAGRIVSVNKATSFVAMGLIPSTHYHVYIYAANTNCSSGIVYNPVPVFSGGMSTMDAPALNHYFGNLHSHSSYSDGNQNNTSLIPSDDYAFGKDALCMDFLGISEHNHYSSPHNPGMHLADYAKGILQANAFTDTHPGFLALYGMEFGVINNGGHVVVYGIDSLLGWETLVGSPNYDIYVGKYDYSGTGGLFNTINRFKDKNAFGYFAHPDDEDYGNIQGVQYQPLADSAIIGSALENGPAFSDETNYHDYPSTMSYLNYYKKLLAKGYHIGPTIDHDNHNLTFGRTTRSRLVVLSPSLGKVDFMESMRSRRFYATHSCAAVMDFQVYGKEMGSIIEHAGAPAMVVTIDDPSASQQPFIKIYKGTDNGNVATLITTVNANSLSFTDEALTDGSSAYYFADISIGSQRTISAPVWYYRNDLSSTVIPDVVPGDNQSLVLLGNPVTNSGLDFQMLSASYGREVIVRIIDMYGRVLYGAKAVNNGGVISVPVGNILPGVYTLEVLDDKKQYRRKFSKY